MPTDRFDVIIIGTGAGGGTLARRLAPSGARILLIERGGFLPVEPHNWDERAVFTDGRYLARETWYDRHDRPFQPYVHYWVGGNTKVYGAALLRLRERDFGEIRHRAGIAPAWPITYDDLEPYYTEAEKLHWVHGLRGTDPTEPRAAAPLPHPPLPHEPRIAELADDLRALGVRPFPAPIGLRPASPTAPARLGRFDGYPDPTRRKADAHVASVEPALAHDNVTLLPGTVVERLITSPSGREITGVAVRREGRADVYQADIVVAACGAINSAALLLRSGSDRHPRGLANSSGLVGRHYMCHNNGLALAVMSTPNPSEFQKTFAITDYYFESPDGSGPLGTIQLMGKPDLGTVGSLAREQLPGRDPAEVARNTIDFFITAEDLPDPDNRVELRDDGSIRLVYRETNTEAYDGLRAVLRQLLARAEARHGRPAPDWLHLKLGISGVSHQNGTLRFGADPRTSVLNPECRAHDVDNLYVADASFFPSSGAVNPSLTIMANALRVGDIILRRLGASPRPSAVAHPALETLHAG